ncbi:MAG TPA: hypothetical protein PKD52_11815 [Clostridiales bacterium]|nr:hypothetical protein [Clostridiales bacterium]
MLKQNGNIPLLFSFYSCFCIRPDRRSDHRSFALSRYHTALKRAETNKTRRSFSLFTRHYPLPIMTGYLLYGAVIAPFALLRQFFFICKTLFRCYNKKMKEVKPRDGRK